MIKAIGFDLGGVILRYGVADELAYLAEKLGVSQTALMDPYHKYRALAEVSQITAQEFWTHLVKESGSQLDPETTEHLWSDNYVNDSPIAMGMLELVDTLKKNGYKVGMFSNIESEHAAANKPRHIFEHFQEVLLSYQARVAKPDKLAYILLAQELGVEPSEMVFIDDLATNIEGANAAGCIGIQFLDYQQLVGDLKQLGVKI
jgi:putative hydrolase of the HAD superfamily